MIIIASKRKKSKSILEKYPDAIIADVTSQAKDGLVKLSPFYPHFVKFIVSTSTNIPLSINF